LNYPRRQQYRRLLRAGGAAIASTGAMLLALGVASAGATSLAIVLLVVAAGFGCSARGWLGLATRSRIGARSEDEVRRQLAAFEHEGWRVRHSLPWRGGGDIDSVAIAPSGLAFAIETKSRPMTSVTSASSGSRPPGYGAVGEDGVAWAPCRFCASSVRLAFSAASAACSSSRSTR